MPEALDKFVAKSDSPAAQSVRKKKKTTDDRVDEIDVKNWKTYDAQNVTGVN